eukprot:294991-Lingulodinium_polyedra.AAC.1
MRPHRAGAGTLTRLRTPCKPLAASSRARSELLVVLLANCWRTAGAMLAGCWWVAGCAAGG